MRDYTQEEMHALFAKIACGSMPEVELKTLLLELKEKGETPAQIAGAAAAFAEAALKFPRGNEELVEAVGTGGDGIGTLNVSTAVAFVAAQMGLKVAKHGSVSVSSKCGSADVLLKAGVKIDMSPDVAKRCLDEVGVTFLYGRKYHTGFQYAAKVRKELHTATIFNILGPLVNPARPNVQLTGVYKKELVRPYAETLVRLGLEKGIVVHGSGIDEIAIHGPTKACLIKNGEVSDFEIDPKEVGIRGYDLKEILGGDSDTNCHALIQLLSGRGSDAYNALVAINTGYLYWVAGRCGTPQIGVEMALQTLKDGDAINLLHRLAEMSHA